MIKPTRTFTFYNEISIDFFEKFGRMKHAYIERSSGRVVPSVTGATGVLDKPALIYWSVKMMRKYLLEQLEIIDKENSTIPDMALPIWRVKDLVEEGAKEWRKVRDESADKGTAVHDWINKYIRYKLGEFKNPPKEFGKGQEEEKNATMAFRDWVVTHDVKFVSTERLVYSKRHGYGGTMDCEAIIDGRKSPVDFKTGNGIYAEAVLQIQGYRIADEEAGNTYDGPNWVIRFGKEDGQFLAKSFEPNDDLSKMFLACLTIKKGEAVLKNFLS